LHHVGQDVTEGLINLLVDLILDVLLRVLDLAEVGVLVSVVHPVVEVILASSIVEAAAVSAVARLINILVSVEFT
jgi:hypothetical protein